MHNLTCTRPVEKVTPTRCCINTSIGYLFPAYFGTHMHTHPPNVVIKSVGKCQIALFYIDVVIGSKGNQQQGRMLLFCLFSPSAVIRLFTCLKAGFASKKLIQVKHLSWLGNLTQSSCFRMKQSDTFKIVSLSLNKWLLFQKPQLF